MREKIGFGVRFFVDYAKSGQEPYRLKAIRVENIYHTSAQLPCPETTQSGISE